MVYDPPKAAHFEAIRNGELLHGLDPVGLKARWAVARRLNCDMLHLLPEDRKAIDEALAAVNAELKPHGIVVGLRD